MLDSEEREHGFELWDLERLHMHCLHHGRFCPALDQHLSCSLGIYLCFSIIEATGGTIRFQSKVGSGTTAQVRLKATERELSSIADSVRRPSGARPAASAPRPS